VGVVSGGGAARRRMWAESEAEIGRGDGGIGGRGGSYISRGVCRQRAGSWDLCDPGQPRLGEQRGRRSVGLL